MSAAGSNRALVRAFIDAVNAQAWDRLESLLAADVIRHSRAGGTLHSRAELVEFLRAELKTFPDARETIEDLIGEGEKIAARQNFTGTQRGPLGAYPPSGKCLKAEYLAIYRCEAGRIVEIWAEWDNLASLIELGHFSPPVG